VQRKDQSKISKSRNPCKIFSHGEWDCASGVVGKAETEVEERRFSSRTLRTEGIFGVAQFREPEARIVIAFSRLSVYESQRGSIDPSFGAVDNPLDDAFLQSAYRARC
jgi:hypothetical protein